MAHSTMTMTIMLITDNGENYVNINVKQTVMMTLMMMKIMLTVIALVKIRMILTLIFRRVDNKDENVCILFLIMRIAISLIISMIW